MPKANNMIDIRFKVEEAIRRSGLIKRFRSEKIKYVQTKPKDALIDD
jgi:hypothetical protein